MRTKIMPPKNPGEFMKRWYLRLPNFLKPQPIPPQPYNSQFFPLVKIEKK